MYRTTMFCSHIRVTVGDTNGYHLFHKLGQIIESWGFSGTIPLSGNTYRLQSCWKNKVQGKKSSKKRIA